MDSFSLEELTGLVLSDIGLENETLGRPSEFHSARVASLPAFSIDAIRRRKCTSSRRFRAYVLHRWEYGESSPSLHYIVPAWRIASHIYSIQRRGRQGQEPCHRGQGRGEFCPRISMVDTSNTSPQARARQRGGDSFPSSSSRFPRLFQASEIEGS